MQVREATHDDEPSVVDELIHPSYRESETIAPGFNALVEDAVAEADCGRWLDHDDRVLFVAERDGELVGHVSGLLTEAPDIYERDQQCHIDGLYVKPDHRRQGIASDLVDRMVAWAGARDCEYLGVTVHVANEAARRLYDDRFDLTFYSYRQPLE